MHVRYKYNKSISEINIAEKRQIFNFLDKRTENIRSKNKQAPELFVLDK